MNRSERLARPSRVAALDGVRGLLALLVVAWHTTEQVGVYWLQSPAKAAVAIFFVLSGYVLTRGWDRRFGVFLVRRFVRLWPVYALCLGVGSILAGIQPAWTTFFWYPCIDPHSSGVDPPNWSLFLEAWTMPFMPLIVWSGSGSALRAGLVMVGAIAAGFIDARITVGAPFVFGAFLARAEFRNPLLELTIPQWLGQISYSLYLTHWLVLTLAARAVGPWGAVAALPAVFAVAWIVWWSVERPSVQASRWISRTFEDYARSISVNRPQLRL